MGRRKGIYTFLILLIAIGIGRSNPPCIDPISTVDWSFFVDTLELKGVCSCSTSGRIKVGLHFQVAEPIAFVEVPRRAWDFPCLGYKRGNSVQRKDGTNKGDLSKVNVHYIKYPVFGVLNIVFDHLCTSKFTEFDFVPTGFSELNPLIWDDELAVLVQPWKLIFATPLAQMTCLADCVASSSVTDVSSNETLRNAMFWCAGCWGAIFPDTTTTYGQNAVLESALIVTRILDIMHESAQLLLYKEVSGLSFIGNVRNIPLPSLDVKCQPVYFPSIVKSQYWLQLAYPVSEEAVPIGKFGIPWVFYRQVPSQEDFVWAVWRIRDCCVGFQFP